LKPVLSLLATLLSMGVVFTLLHHSIIWLGVGDLVALLLFAAPVSAYVAYCTHRKPAEQIRAAWQIYASFSLVVLAAAGLVYVIGTG
jgi:hypothetical protein